MFDRELDDLDMGTGHGGTGTVNKLHLASRRGDLEEVKWLTEKKGFNPLQKGKYGHNALHYAAWEGHVRVMKYYVEERRCNPANKDSKGWTCLHHAARYNHLEIVQYLVDIQNVDPMCQSKSGDTPLHLYSLCWWQCYCCNLPHQCNDQVPPS